MIIKNVAVSVVATLALPATAKAQLVQPGASTGRVVAAATAWWQAKGYTVCADPTIESSNAGMKPEWGALAWNWTCHIRLRPRHVRTLETPRWVKHRRWIEDTRAARQKVCTLMFHEVGHLAGLEHAPGGVMAEDASIYNYVPGPCRDFARDGARWHTAEHWTGAKAMAFARFD